MQSVATQTKNKTIILQNSGERLSLLVGPEVLAKMAIQEFQHSWDRLYDQCPWATVFQSRAFVAAWFSTYHQKYLPVLVTYESKGRLAGLFALAKNNNGVITGAGDIDAEYHVWLSLEQDSDLFIKSALVELQKRFPKSNIQLKYLPANAPMKWMKEKDWSGQCLLQQIKLPLLHINDESLSNELKKKSNRYKINRLKRNGVLKFERIKDITAFTEVFDEIVLQYDFRRRAMYNVSFFDNEEARQFFFTMFESGLLHVTVLRLNEEIVASAIATIGRGTYVHCKGVNTYSLFYARSSPGILHILMMGRLLAEEGTEVLDFSPGSDYYKEYLANEYGEVSILTVGSAYKLAVKKMKLATIEFIKRTAVKWGVQRRNLKKIKWNFFLFKDKVLHVIKKEWLAPGKRALWGADFFAREKIYRVDNFAPTAHSPIHLQKNSLGDLMEFDLAGARPTPWEFLSDAMHRFEEGEHCFSYCENKKLLFCCWLLSHSSSSDENLDEGSLLLHRFYCHPEGRHRLTEFLNAAIAETISISGNNHVQVQSTSKAVSKSLQAAGFKPYKQANA